MPGDERIVPQLTKSTYGNLTGVTLDLATACIERGLIVLVDDRETSEVPK